MKMTHVYGYGALALLLAGSSAVLSSPGRSRADAPKEGATPYTVSDVLVTNTTGQPVPTAAQGTTTVSGSVKSGQSGNWVVGISGTPTVALSGTPTVKSGQSGNWVVGVSNAASSPVPVALVNEGVRQPFQQQVHVTTDASTGFGSASITVPAGWRLVIEHVNGFAYVGQQDDLSDYQLDTTYKSNSVSYEFAPVDESASDHYHTYVNESVVAYADPGSTVNLDLETSEAGGSAPSADGYISVSGYLEK